MDEYEDDEDYGIPPGGLEALEDEEDKRLREYLESIATATEEQEYGLPSYDEDEWYNTNRPEQW